MKNPPLVENSDFPHESYVKLAENRLAEMLDTQVKIIYDTSTRQIQINFADDTQLLQIIRNIDRNISTAEENTMSKEEKIAALRKFSTEGSLGN